LPHRKANPDPRANAADKSARDYERRQHEIARWLWGRRQPLEGSIAEIYLREVRAYKGPLPPTLAFLLPYKDHPPSLICAFSPHPGEIEPGILAEPCDVQSVQLIALKPDGSGKAGVEVPKRSIGAHKGLPIVVSPPNDGLGLAICEGIEDALSVYEATGLGCWASGGATFLAALADTVAGYIDVVTICQHPDTAGRQGARELARRLAERGVEIRIVGGGHE
jgi:putative DNA primase/helicase